EIHARGGGARVVDGQVAGAGDAGIEENLVIAPAVGDIDRAAGGADRQSTGRAPDLVTRGGMGISSAIQRERRGSARTHVGSTGGGQRASRIHRNGGIEACYVL